MVSFQSGWQAHLVIICCVYWLSCSPHNRLCYRGVCGQDGRCVTINYHGCALLMNQVKYILPTCDQRWSIIRCHWPLHEPYHIKRHLLVSMEGDRQSTVTVHWWWMSSSSVTSYRSIWRILQWTVVTWCRPVLSTAVYMSGAVAASRSLSS